MHNILVTGGNGFIGKHLVAELIDADLKVTVVDNLVPGPSLADVTYPQNCIDFLTNAIARAGLSNLDDLIGSSEKYSAVIHLAAIPRVGAALKSPGRILSNNIGATLAVAEYCRVSNTPLVNISSGAAKWANTQRNPYALSKDVGEQIIDTYRETFNVDATNVRLFNVYGQGEVSNGADTTLIRKCKTSVWGNVPLSIFGDGCNLRDYTHVFDAVKGIMAVLADNIDGRFSRPLYELGTCQPVSVNEIVERFMLTGMRTVHVAPRIGDQDYTCADATLRPAGWTPKINVLEHIDRWIELGCPFD